MKLLSEGLVFERGEVLVGRPTETDFIPFPDKLEAHCSRWTTVKVCTYNALAFTAGSFTREAKGEAQRDRASPIDLIDGLEFAEAPKSRDNW